MYLAILIILVAILSCLVTVEAECSAIKAALGCADDRAAYAKGHAANNIK
jgi:hypothetical protein